jgi:hypothetical protein
MKRIIFKRKDNGVTILDPASNYPQRNPLGLTVEQVAKKDSEAGQPYWIVDASEVPTDKTFRNAWTVDETATPPDGYGASDEESAEIVAELYVLRTVAQVQANADAPQDTKDAAAEIQRAMVAGETTAVEAQTVLIELLGGA